MTQRSSVGQQLNSGFSLQLICHTL